MRQTFHEDKKRYEDQKTSSLYLIEHHFF